MELNLSENEVEVIGRVLNNFLGDLRMEIADTENHDFREGWKQDEQTINTFLARLQTPSPSKS